MKVRVWCWSWARTWGWLKPGDHVIALYTPECRQCKFCLSRKTNLCQAIRSTQGKGVMPDGSRRFSNNGEPTLHHMGTSTFANHTVVLGIGLAKIRPDAPFDVACYIGCGVTTGVGAVLVTAKVDPIVQLTDGGADVPKIVDWYMDGKLNIDELITHRLKLEDINEGFELMKRGESIRSVVVFCQRCLDRAWPPVGRCDQWVLTTARNPCNTDSVSTAAEPPWPTSPLSLTTRCCSRPASRRCSRAPA